MFGDNFAKELQSKPLSNDTVSRQIDDIAEDVEQQLFACGRRRLLQKRRLPHRRSKLEGSAKRVIGFKTGVHGTPQVLKADAFSALEKAMEWYEQQLESCPTQLLLLKIIKDLVAKKRRCTMVLRICFE
ncbi:hypothetical protein TNCV_121201 [Trichonephila clavipes]|nr:hypothetical protein TNCV_121201 [Trichonephila clavipes]